MPTELRNAIAVADSLLEPRIAIPEEATICKTEEREEGITTGDGEGKEESSSKVRTKLYIYFVILTVLVLSTHSVVRVHPRRRRRQSGQGAVDYCLDS